MNTGKSGGSDTRVGVRRRTVRMIVGLVSWLGLLVTGQALVQDHESHRETRALAHVNAWLLGKRSSIEVKLDKTMKLQVGDPVFFGPTQSDLTLVGEVIELLDDGRQLNQRTGSVRGAICELSLSGHEGLNTDSKISVISVPQTAAWVLQTLLPPEKIAWIAREWNLTLLAHRDELFEAIAPVLRGLVTDFQVILSEALPPALARRGGRFAELGDRYQEVIINRELKPVIESDLWPILESRARPTLDAIGTEIIKRLPVWSLGWRLVYEALPLTDDRLVREAWNQFVSQEVMPILRDHLDDFLGSFRDVIAAASRNEKVAAAFRRSFDVLMADPEFQHELRLIFQEVVLDNPRFHSIMIKRWQSAETTEAINKLSIFMGPLLSRLGDAILGTRGGGITPEFARVLRTQILEKDRRWFLVQPGQKQAAPIRDGHLFEAKVVQDD